MGVRYSGLSSERCLDFLFNVLHRPGVAMPAVPTDDLDPVCRPLPLHGRDGLHRKRLVKMSW